MTELTNQCDDCGWILGYYIYTYDDRGYIVAEHTEEAREADPYGRQSHTLYKPDRTGKNCDHGRNRNLSCYLLVLDKTYTYDKAGKLLTATETEKGCGTLLWRYAYDAMGNRTLEEKKTRAGRWWEYPAGTLQNPDVRCTSAAATQLRDFVVAMPGEIKCPLRVRLISCWHGI